MTPITKAQDMNVGGRPSDPLHVACRPVNPIKRSCTSCKRFTIVSYILAVLLMANVPAASITHDMSLPLSPSDYASVLRVLTWAIPTAVLNSVAGHLRGAAKIDEMPFKTRLERAMIKRFVESYLYS
jgi:hypothetical protein